MRLQRPEWHQFRDAIARVRTQNPPRGVVGIFLPFWACIPAAEAVTFVSKPSCQGLNTFVLLKVSGGHDAAASRTLIPWCVLLIKGGSARNSQLYGEKQALLREAVGLAAVSAISFL